MRGSLIMIKFLTSNLNHYHKVNGEKIANEIDDKNGLVKQLKQYLKGYKKIVYIAADSKDREKVISYSKLLFEALKLSGIEFENYYVIDDTTKENAQEYIENADLIFLSGGDTYIEMQFFNEINLKELLALFNGVIIGQSAGSINMATDVFNSPEEQENSEPIYFGGLGLTDINTEPHFVLDANGFDDNELYQRNYILAESFKRKIYALCDTSHILIDNNEEIMYGESYIIQNGVIEKICDHCESKSLVSKEVSVKK